MLLTSRSGAACRSDRRRAAPKPLLDAPCAHGLVITATWRLLYTGTEDQMTENRHPESEADRRIYPRSPLVVREARLISGMEVFFGYAQNVSRAGLFIGTSKRRPEGELYEIQFKLPGLEKDFRCKAKVVWARPYRKDSPYTPGIGLEFVDLPEEDAALIDKWVEDNDDRSLEE